MGVECKNYPHSYKRQVFLYETDAFGHLNNVFYFHYLESARFELLKEMELFDPKNILSLNYILVHAECDYRQISRYDDILIIHSRVSEIKSSSFALEHLITNEKTGDLVATARMIIVAFNHKKQKSEPLTPKVKKILETYLGK